MSSPLSQLTALRRWPWGRLVALAVLLAAGVWFAASPLGVRGAVDQGIGFIRSVGPLPYFVAMALLPVPLSWFTVPAGEAFAATMTLPGVMAAAIAAVAVQTAWCYWVARRALRPVLERWFARRGWTVPKVTADNALAVMVLVRLVPGPPLPLQCFLLSLAGVPFGLYMVVSTLFSVPWVIGGIMLGRGVLGGNWTIIGLGVGVVGIGASGFYLLRKRWTPRATA